MAFLRERGIAPCGLACAACSVKDCPGCVRRGADSMCEKGRCSAQKEMAGCWECGGVDCAYNARGNIRVRSFLRFANEKGVAGLLDALERNHAAGIHYHRANQIRGDYDDLDSEEDMLAVLETGAFPDPYAHCPSFETESLRLRLVSQEDAVELLACYADPITQSHTDAGNYGFAYDTPEGMRDCIESWLDEYAAREFIRWTVIHKGDAKAVGTIEYFPTTKDARAESASVRLGVLRIDLKSEYEKKELFDQLLDIVIGKLQCHMPSDAIIAKVEECDTVRMAAYTEKGFIRPKRENLPECYLQWTK